MSRYTVEVEFEDAEGDVVLEQVEVDADDEHHAGDLAMEQVEGNILDSDDIDYIKVNSVELMD